MVAAVPYVTVPVFKAHPTFLDLNNLRSGDTVLADQEAELANILLMASSWADDKTGRSADTGSHGLAAASYVERTELRTDRRGRLLYQPDNYPVMTVTGLSWGVRPADLRAVTDLTALWVERRKRIVAELGQLGLGMTSLQFGAPGTGRELYTQWSYVGGYPHTVTAGTAAAGATSVTVTDPTGITPGQVLRIWEPGAEETVTVASGYTPGTAAVTLVSTLAHAHTAGAMVSALPPAVVLAVINYSVAALMRPDTAAEDAYPDTSVQSSTRKPDSRRDGSGLVAEAERLLMPYTRRR